MLELAGPDGTPQRHEVGSGERIPTGHNAATLGLGLEEGKAVLAALQRHLVAAQVDEHCRSRRRCDRYGAQRPLKELRPRRLSLSLANFMGWEEAVEVGLAATCTIGLRPGMRRRARMNRA